METISSSNIDKYKETSQFLAERGVKNRRHIYSSVEYVFRRERFHLSHSDVSQLFLATQYASMRVDNWRGITISLSLLDAPQSAEATLRALIDHLRHWQERKGVPPYWAWVREQGALLGDHVHILAAIPKGSGRTLSGCLRRWLAGPSIRGEVVKDVLHSRPTTTNGWLCYACKAITPADATALFVQTGLRIAPEKPGGPVIGQRRGIARCLGQKAREADATCERG